MATVRLEVGMLKKKSIRTNRRKNDKSSKSYKENIFSKSNVQFLSLLDLTIGEEGTAGPMGPAGSDSTDGDPGPTDPTLSEISFQL